MGFFRDLGRRAEKLKSEATDAAEEQADYECADCGKAIFTDRETCPACGSEAVVARAGTAAEETADADEPAADADEPAADADHDR
jgi:predicted RNA-binding Zn-ribbon protein involved in translation (DUF1610 family)